ncbi:hypothetical protein LPTSP4_05720 [Leptospira ryugenii]|uniref:Uncharacterized protein n=1 Tax=Leptospira ryugenii TaxID=1917863 RepID=A0A2P2DWQ4_9LEPT|nr:hypothetical protein LPTSP4_05720 [Leptospira ryugenii]
MGSATEIALQAMPKPQCEGVVKKVPEYQKALLKAFFDVERAALWKETIGQNQAQQTTEEHRFPTNIWKQIFPEFINAPEPLHYDKNLWGEEASVQILKERETTSVLLLHQKESGETIWVLASHCFDQSPNLEIYICSNSLQVLSEIKNTKEQKLGDLQHITSVSLHIMDLAEVHTLTKWEGCYA